MHNIPPLNHTHRSHASLQSRAKKITAGENTTGKRPVSGKIDRRKQQRRTRQLTVQLEQRQLGHNRRKSDFFRQDDEDFTVMGDTVGKHINTTG